MGHWARVTGHRIHRGTINVYWKMRNFITVKMGNMKSRIFAELSLTCVVLFAWLAFAPAAHAATNISSSTSQHWAWNDVVGWIDFYNTNTITVSGSGLTGYASSSAGPISLDCHTSPSGNICSSGNGNYQILNDGTGNLSGWAWNDSVGWISFWCGDAGVCGTSPYRVTIDSSGNFHGYAWNDLVGWISFNCSDPGLCGTSNYLVNTSWTVSAATGTLDSTTFDTGVTNGAQLNAIIWQGSQPVGTSVGFQIAVSNASSGPWNFTGPSGSSATTWSSSGPGVPIPLAVYTAYNNYRYFRYRVILTSNTSQTATPRVDDVMISWSP